MISIVVEPQGVHTCRSSTLVVLADSGPFRGLLLTVLGSRSDFHDRRSQRFVYVSNVNTQSFAILARFVDYYSQFWGPGVISTIDDPRCAFTCRSSTLAVFVDSSPFHGLLLTVLGSQSDFHD